jgi:hypothetical protein
VTINSINPWNPTAKDQGEARTLQWPHLRAFTTNLANLCIYICIYMCIYTYGYMYMYVYVYIYSTVYIYICIFIFIFICACIYVYMRLYIYKCKYIYTYIYIHIYIYIHVYTCILKYYKHQTQSWWQDTVSLFVSMGFCFTGFAGYESCIVVRFCHDWKAASQD